MQVHILYVQFWNPKSYGKYTHTHTGTQRITSLAAKLDPTWNLMESKPDQSKYEAIDCLGLSLLCDIPKICYININVWWSWIASWHPTGMLYCIWSVYILLSNFWKMLYSETNSDPGKGPVDLDLELYLHPRTHLICLLYFNRLFENMILNLKDINWPTVISKTR